MIRIVLTTTDTPDEAGRLARTLVSERLTACVNIIPKVMSIYKWKGKLEESSEFILLMKTTQAGVEALSHRLRQIHSYDVPEIVVVPVEGGLPQYLSWVESEVAEI